MNATEACTLAALLRTTYFGNFSLKAFPYHISEGKQLLWSILFPKLFKLDEIFTNVIKKVLF